MKSDGQITINGKPRRIVRWLMKTLLGLMGLGFGACTRGSSALPPPPFIPKYSVEYAIERLRKSSCAANIEPFEIGDEGEIRGWRSKEGPDVDVVLYATLLFTSGTGVRYWTNPWISIDPVTAEPLESDCTAKLKSCGEWMVNAIERAERSPQVRAFLEAHAGRVKGHVSDYHGGADAYIVYIAIRADGEEEVRHWDGYELTRL